MKLTLKAESIHIIKESCMYIQYKKNIYTCTYVTDAKKMFFRIVVCLYY